MKKGFFLFGMFALGACDNSESKRSEPLEFENRDEVMAYYLEPQYGDERPISGNYAAQFEVSAINICDTRPDCTIRRNVDGSPQRCWVDFTDEVYSQWDTRLARDGNYWLSGRGRIAVLPGSFGHLGQYTCQVEVTALEVLEDETHLFAPPTKAGN